MPDFPALFNDPVLFAALTVIIAAVVMWQRTLTWPEYRRFHTLKVRFLPLLDRYTTLFVVSRKRGRDDPEYLTTREEDVREVFSQLRAGGCSPHLVNALKVRPDPAGSGKQYTAAHLVYTHTDGTQTEAYLFAASAGTDVYAHHEPGVVNADAHLEGPQADGDPRGVLRAALDNA
jgi:hypothetical protein